ncbi:MAG: hypothetical protein GQ546_07060, partial [Gammaproteobacteria bacterium]|nr:hypothetical protein [Gammaproteobacteria bacterium]
MAQSIGQVIFISGNVKAVDSLGNERELDINSMVYLGETIVTEGTDSRIMMKMDNNQSITLGRNDKLTLDGDIYDPTAMPIQESIASVESIQEALLNDPDFDPTELEATAAGDDNVSDSSAEPIVITHTQQGVEYDFLDTIGVNDEIQAVDDFFANSRQLVEEDLPQTIENDAPTIDVIANDFTEDAGGLTAGVSVAATYSTADAENDAVTVTFNSSSAHYTLGSGVDAGKVLLTQAGIDVINAGGTLDDIDLKVTEDGDASQFGTDLDTPVVTPVNDVPIAFDDNVSMDEDTSVDIDILANDTGLGDAPVTITTVTQGTNGTVAINSDGTIKYTPNTNYSGADSFTYTIADADGETSTATVNLNVIPVADALFPDGDFSVVIGDPVDYDLTGATLTGTTWTTASGITVVGSGDINILNTNNGLGLGVDSHTGTGEEANRIDPGENIKFT